MKTLLEIAKRRDSLFLFVVAPVLSVSALGCSLFAVLFTDAGDPVRYYKAVECRATVQSEEGALVSVATGWTQGFPQRRYWVCASDDDCPSDAASFVRTGRSVSEFETDWNRFIHQQIGMISDGSLEFPESEFALLEGPWCIQEPTSECQATDIRVADTGEASDPNFVLDPLDDPGFDLFCPVPIDPPTPEPCLEVTCGDGPCEEIDFGAVGVGDSAEPKLIKINNCGVGDLAPVIEVRADGTVFPDGIQGDFATFDNTCLPDTPEEQQIGSELLPPNGVGMGNSGCGFVVNFEPQTAFEHTGHLLIEEIGGAEIEIDLVGQGLGGALEVTDAATGEPVVEACFQQLGNQECAPAQALRLGNFGPGVLTVTGGEISAGDNFSVTGDLLDQLPWTLEPGGLPVQIEVQACTGTVQASSLLIFSNEPGQPSREIPLTIKNGPCE